LLSDDQWTPNFEVVAETTALVVVVAETSEQIDVTQTIVSAVVAAVV
jgi:hypothetical protein